MNHPIIENIRAMLAPVPAYWLLLTENAPDHLMKRPAAPGEWSAFQCLCHLLDTERMVFPARLRVFISGGDSFPAFDPDSESTDYSDMRPVDVAREFARHRTQNLQLVDELDGGQLENRARHSELGMVTLSELLHEWVAHDLNHTVQAERALMQPFITAARPWRHYFKDHDLGSGA